MGTKIFVVEEGEPVIGCLIATAVLSFCILYPAFLIAEKLTSWQTLSMPYNYVACFYYYTIIVPLKGFHLIWKWVDSQNITKYPNINLVLAGLSEILYFLGLLIINFLIKALFNMVKISFLGMVGIFLFPAFAIFLWSIILYTYHWLFAL